MRILKNCSWLVLLILAIVSLSVNSANAEPKPRETWHAFVANGQRYGYERVKVSKRTDGNYLYSVDSRVLIDLMGQQKQEYLSKAEYVVTPSYQPVSVHLEVNGPTGKLSVNGTARDGELPLTFRRGDLSWFRSVEIDDTVILLSCLVDYLNGQKNQAGRRSITLLDTDNWHTHSSTIVLQSESSKRTVWSVELGGNLGHGTITLGADGTRQVADLRNPPRRIVRCTSEEASKLEYRTYVGRDVLMFPLTEEVGNPRKLISLTVRLSWKDVPFGDLELEDGRQSVIENRTVGDQYDVTVRIGMSKPIDDPIAFPVTDARFVDHLAETPFIKPNDESIKRQAQEWVQGSTDSLQAVQALSKHVSEYLAGGSLIAETLSGPEVLYLKQGKCSEFSTLFASLARSVRIPTRIVLGERMTEAGWVGHMWNEAYVGEWVTVDSTVNEVGDSRSLLKFVTSDTVLGTQNVRFGLTDSLDIRIVEVEKEPSAIAEKWKTGIDGLSYTNVDFNCRLTARDDGWTLNDKSKGTPVIQFKAPDKDVLIHFVAFGVPGNLSPKFLLGIRQARFAVMYKEFKVLKNEAFAIDAIKGHMLVFQRKEKGDKGRKMKTTEYMWSNGKSAYLLNLIAEEKKHDGHVPALNKLLQAFESLD